MFRHNFATGNEKQLTHDKKIIDEVYGTNNGYIFYSSNRAGNFNIWAIPSEGGDAVQITRGAGPDFGISISTAANRLIYSQRTDISKLWMVNTDGSHNRQVFPDENIYNSSLTTDASTFAIQVQNRIGDVTLMTRNIKTGRQEFLFPYDSTVSRVFPRWSPSGQKLSYIDVIVKKGINHAIANVITISGGKHTTNLGEGVPIYWLTDSTIIVVRNIAAEKEYPKYSEAHSVNINTNEDKLFFRKGIPAVPVLDNAAILYSSDNMVRIVSRKELSVNADALGKILMKQSDFSSDIISNRFVYYTTQDPKTLWKMNLKTNVRSKIIDLPQGDQISFGDIDYKDRTVTYQRFNRKTNIVKVDNLFTK